MKIGIIGNGFVGKATNVLKCKDIEIIMYDINPELCVPPNTNLDDICRCDIVFVSVPTPVTTEGNYFLGIVESVMSDISKHSKNIEKEPLVVLRSTVTPGVSDNLNCFFMPEFLTEKNFLNDFKTNPDWIFGLKNDDKQNFLFKRLMQNLMTTAKNNGCIESDNCHFVANSEAEMIKLFRNNYLSVKVSFCNEIYDYCQSKNINYENVRSLAVRDKRIGGSHTNVPGHDGNRGFGGTCFPKDTSALLYDMSINNVQSHVISGAVYRNKNIDRPNVWNEAENGRGIIKKN